MRAAIFDLDGTLADTAGDLMAAANAALAEAGIAGRLEAGRDEGVALRGGRPMLRLGFERAGRAVDEALVDGMYPALLEHYARALAVETRLYEGVEAALALLAEAGWALGVCTNKPQGLADRLLAELGIAGRFGAVLGADALPVRKPDPRHLTETILRAGGAGSRGVLIGDTVTDRDTARAAGVPCVLVGFGAQGGEAAALMPAAILGHYDDLPALLDALVPMEPVTAGQAARRGAGMRPAPRVP